MCVYSCSMVYISGVGGSRGRTLEVSTGGGWACGYRLTGAAGARSRPHIDRSTDCERTLCSLGGSLLAVPEGYLG